MTWRGGAVAATRHLEAVTRTRQLETRMTRIGLER